MNESNEIDRNSVKGLSEGYPMLSLKEKVVAITGIGSPDHPKGNGRAIAELFAAQGGFIEGLDIQENEGQRTTRAILSAGGGAILSLAM